MAEFATELKIEAPIEEVWQVLADVGTISLWNPGVVDSHLLSDETEGLGSARHCDLGGKNYLKEQVVEWEYCRRLTMRVVDTNMPMESADIRFTLERVGDDTLVTVSPEYELKYGFVGAIMDRLMVRKSYAKGMDSLLAGLKDYVESGRGEGVTTGDEAVVLVG
jgi:uncharacterized membrane protein